MKKLIFVDNDTSERSKIDIHDFVKPLLIKYGGIDEKDLDIEIMSKLYQQDQDKLYDIFYHPDNVIISWSTYTLTPDRSNSKQQLLRFLRTANDMVLNANYIDMSGQVEQALHNTLRFDDLKGVFAILTAIENNNIITRDSAGKFVRLRISFKNHEVFTHEQVDMKSLLGTTDASVRQ